MTGPNGGSARDPDHAAASAPGELDPAKAELRRRMQEFLRDSAPDAPRPNAWLDRLYLAHLLFAPLGATVLAVVTYKGPGDFVLALLWLGGASTVAVYAAFVGLYYSLPRGRFRPILAIVDGPLWVLVAAVTLDGWGVLDLATWLFVSESLAIFIGIAVLALRSFSPKEAAPSVGIMVVCIAVVCFACGWAFWPHLLRSLKDAALFCLGLTHSTIGAYRAADNEAQVRSQEMDSRIILATVGLFHVAIGVGAALRLWLLR
ncbi:MAG: hypothetical protein IRZ16_19060 [Myxococcaceae bacterium]|nr:hypothetical protein [Myxococcaceae bacterium]